LRWERVLCSVIRMGIRWRSWEVESRYTPDKAAEVREVYGTTDMTHPGVRYVMNSDARYVLGRDGARAAA
jgi:ATP sulfurylase